MGFRLSGQVLESKTGLTPAQKLIMLGLAERADREGRYAFPSVATLAGYAECSERTVELGLQALVSGGWIQVQRPATNRLPTTYMLNLAQLSRGEETSPQTAPKSRGEETSPQKSRGELLGTLGANFSASRGEETSPDPVSTEPILEPIQKNSSKTTTRERVREQRRTDRQREEELLDLASSLVLELTPEARRPLELEALADLEPFRDRMTSSHFDDLVCRALPKRLIQLAKGRPLVDVVAELERQAAAA